MADVFVSYVSEDRAIAEKIAGGLSAAGFSVWWDRHIRGGAKFGKEIERELSAAKVVVVLWSADALGSEWVRDEAEQARDENKLIPICLDGVQPPLGLRQSQSLDFSRWKGDPNATPFADLVDSARLFLGRPDPATPVVASARTSSAGRNRILIWFATAALVVAGAGMWWLLRGARDLPQPATPRTAVSPFRAPSGDPVAKSLAEGIVDEVDQTMAFIGLPVIARGSLESMEGPGRSAKAIALGAEYELDGDVRREEEQLVVSIRINALRSGTTLWTGTYRGIDADAVVMRTQIATQAADQLRCASPQSVALGLGAFGIGAQDVDSLQMLLRACAQTRAVASDQSRRLLRDLVERYPDSAVLNGRLGIALAMSVYSAPPTARPALVEEAERAARRAIELDPHAGEGYMALQEVKARQGAPPNDIEAVLLEGLRHAPEHAGVNNYYGQFLLATGRITEALAYLRRGVDGDPLSSSKPIHLALGLSESGQLIESESVLRELFARWPTYWAWTELYRLVVFSQAGNVADLPTRSSMVPIEHRACWQILATAMTTRDVVKRRQDGVAATQRCVDDGVLSVSDAIRALASFGDIDGAFAQADRLERGDLLSLFHTSPMSGVLVHDPRFLPLMQRLGYLDYWVTSDHWPDFCAQPDLPYDCRLEAARLREQPVSS